MSRTIRFTCTSDHDGRRADQVIADQLPDVHRSQLRARLTDLQVNDRPAKPATRLREGDLICATISDPPLPRVSGEPISLELVAETPDYLLVNKEQGMVVHPGAGHHSGTLVHALVGRYGDTFFGSGEDDTSIQRPGIVHRLDRETSGIMIVARTPAVQAWLVEQFARRRVSKRYLAIVRGQPRWNEGLISGAIGRHPQHRVRFAVHGQLRHLQTVQGAAAPEANVLPGDNDEAPRGARSAITHYRVLQRYAEGYALLWLMPHTGRTHQLRVHMQQLGHPILGDPLYARSDPRFPDARLMLHARELELRPSPHQPRTRFRAAVPLTFRDVLAGLTPE